MTQEKIATKSPDEVVGEYHKELRERLFEVESKFDNAALLVAGGAFTVSAAYAPKFSEISHSAWALATAWTSWAVCVAASVGGHLASAECYQRRIKAIAEKAYDEVVRKTLLERIIRPLNWATFASLVIGLIFFGIFTYSNLNFGVTHGQSEKKGKEEGIQTRVRPVSTGEQHSGSTTGVPSQQKEKEIAAHERQGQTTDSATTQGRAPPFREKGSSVGQQPKAGSSEQRARSTTGVPD